MMARHITECMWCGLRSCPNSSLHLEFQIYSKLYMKFQTMALGNEVLQANLYPNYNKSNGDKLCLIFC